MSKIHEVKLLQGYCDSVYDGSKTFEVRHDDRVYQVGDFIKFIPIIKIPIFPNFERISHPVSDKLYKITYKFTGIGVCKGYAILGIKECSPSSEDNAESGE